MFIGKRIPCPRLLINATVVVAAIEGATFSFFGKPFGSGIPSLGDT
jgi:hypothetical protein